MCLVRVLSIIEISFTIVVCLKVCNFYSVFQNYYSCIVVACFFNFSLLIYSSSAYTLPVID